MTELHSMQRILILFLFFTGLSNLNAQCNQDYRRQVEKIMVDSKATKSKNPRLVLAGSSTFRLWVDAGKNFPEYAVVNAGIGGSCFNDLWTHREQLLIDTKPEILAIYEGDNDLAAGQSIEEIAQNAAELIEWFQVRTNLDVPIVLVAPKPSPRRIGLASKYLELNDLLKDLCRFKNVGFVDTWPVLCTPEGVPNPEFYQADQLHLNDRGNAALGSAMKVEIDRLHALYSLKTEHVRLKKRAWRSGAALATTHTLMAAHGVVIFRKPYTWQGLDQAVWLAIHSPGVVATEIIYWLRCNQLRRFELELKAAC